ncbi:tRNA (adenosine(37)-N6)-threonylcarbamoyltransferase complex dimerization subunit type 1 TsaB [Dongia sedimenti]|uniref:tRNA (Adenosine(37)-N6)-threonylcarbamoyltransferase complex dimerization subunit type 1 TsaB n=1 Tax=Dongia sedimenti TaxID=3064282 RepID=A0ABU0YQB3_9PROT|nr:tRNA (adenosine(37)-N6)-threonylcarbamoyltransferase complex dimerization subunit type 1 TsaB [Rhodospirillaceae bacterium R-7]
MTNRTDPAGKARPGTILGIETGSRGLSVAILKDARPLAREAARSDHGQATMLMPMIERVRAAAGLGYAELDRIAVAAGPGSFTGLRVGLAAALGLALASGVPAVGISSFHAAAGGVERWAGARLIVVLDSRRDEPFVAELGGDADFLRTPSVMSVAALDALVESAAPVLLCGDAPALERYRARDGIRVQMRAADAADVARLAADPERRFDLPPKPVYIRPPDVTMPKPA